MNPVSHSWPDDSIQWMLHPSPWWEPTKDLALCRGRLVRAFFPYVDQQPMVLVVEGRKNPTGHASAVYRVEPFDSKSPNRAPPIPVAAMPHHKGERRFVYRGKMRPALVIATGGNDVPKHLVASSAPWIAMKTILVAPFFGADQDGSRGGWPPAFVERIRHAEYPQYLWDHLPLNDVKESVLRLDQLQCVGAASKAMEVQPYRLSMDALGILDEWLTWVMNEGLPEDGFVHEFRQSFAAAGSGGAAVAAGRAPA